MADEAGSEKQSRIDELRRELEELESETVESDEAVVDDAVEAAADVVDDIQETAAEGAETVEEAAQQVEDVVEEIAEEAAADASLSKEEMFDYIMGRLQTEGHLQNTHETPAQVESEVLETAPVQPETVGVDTTSSPDTPPQPEHWWFRNRRGRR